MIERLYQNYKNDIVTVLQNKFNYKNLMEIPKIDKVVINMGVGEAVKDSKKIEIAQKELASITGQFPIITKAKKANASFKLREGMSVGLKVTLRKSKMYEFIDRLINIALPRVRDFRGISDKSFDGKGNYSLGLKEQFIFPEIEYDTVDTPRGMDITIVTTAKTDDEARELLKNFTKANLVVTIKNWLFDYILAAIFKITFGLISFNSCSLSSDVINRHVFFYPTYLNLYGMTTI